MREGVDIVVLLILLAILFPLVAFGVMLAYNGLDLNLLVGGPDMTFEQALGVTAILGVLAR